VLLSPGCKKKDPLVLFTPEMQYYTLTSRETHTHTHTVDKSLLLFFIFFRTLPFPTTKKIKAERKRVNIMTNVNTHNEGRRRGTQYIG